MEESRNWIVYEHISPSNKVYVGITSASLEKRSGPSGSRYLLKTKNGKFYHPIFASAILKYGWNNMEHHIVYTNLTKKEADKMEMNLIKKYKMLGLSYNVTDGGDGTKGIKFKHSKEAKRKISLHHAPITAETIEKIRKTMTGQKYSKERRLALSKGHDKEKIPVDQYTLDGKYIASFESIMAAERATGVRNSGIAFCISGKYKQSGGYIWKKVK